MKPQWQRPSGALVMRLENDREKWALMQTVDAGDF
jgi:hypothetical protein